MHQLYAAFARSTAIILITILQPALAQTSYQTEIIANGLQQPSDIEFIGDDRLLILQRNVPSMALLNTSTGELTNINGLPEIYANGDSGLHDLAVHPGYAGNGWIYLSYSEGDQLASTTVVDRFKLNDNQLVERERLFTADAYSEDNFHYGGRMLFANGYLFITIGDRHHRDRAQDNRNHTGTIVRLLPDGGVPDDNPLVNQASTANTRGGATVKPEIWSYGHRHPQGLMYYPPINAILSHEHGPRGGDELNVIQAGGNYGWPVISFGFEYDGGPIGKGIVSEDGMQQPLWVWVPSIAPSDMLYYDGAAFPTWRGSILSGSMAYQHLNRIVIQDNQVVLEERLVYRQHGRIRSLAVDQNGLIYLGSDSGQIVRMQPTGD